MRLSALTPKAQIRAREAWFDRVQGRGVRPEQVGSRRVAGQSFRSEAASASSWAYVTCAFVAESHGASPVRSSSGVCPYARAALDAWTNRRMPSGCDHCNATQLLTRTEPGTYTLTITHEATCPLHHGGTQREGPPPRS